MGLFRKVRVLVRALAPKPFTPKPERVDLDEKLNGQEPLEERPVSPGLADHEPELGDTERVADLIAQRQREEGG